MTVLSFAYSGDADLAGIVELIDACEEVDHLHDSTSVEELRVDFSFPQTDPTRNAHLWKDEQGRVIGYTRLWLFEPGETQDVRLLDLKVRPGWRGKGLEVQMLQWAEQRAQEVGKAHGLAAELQARIRDDQTEMIALFQAQGYTLERYFWTMDRALAEPIPEPTLPAGFTMRQTAGAAEAEQYVAMFNETWIDHWKGHPMTVEHFLHDMALPDYRAEMDRVIESPAGTLAAFCYSRVSTEENARTGRSEGWIDALGTRRGFRKLGLGRALLLDGLLRLRAEGVTTARLTVDAASLTGANRLYESAGFRVAETRLALAKQFPL